MITELGKVQGPSKGLMLSVDNVSEGVEVGADFRVIVATFRMRLTALRSVLPKDVCFLSTLFQKECKMELTF